jgi:hypothetical protein
VQVVGFMYLINNRPSTVQLFALDGFFSIFFFLVMLERSSERLYSALIGALIVQVKISLYLAE